MEVHLVRPQLRNTVVAQLFPSGSGVVWWMVQVLQRVEAGRLLHVAESYRSFMGGRARAGATKIRNVTMLMIKNKLFCKCVSTVFLLWDYFSRLFLFLSITLPLPLQPDEDLFNPDYVEVDRVLEVAVTTDTETGEVGDTQTQTHSHRGVSLLWKLLLLKLLGVMVLRVLWHKYSECFSPFLCRRWPITSLSGAASRMRKRRGSCKRTWIRRRSRSLRRSRNCLQTSDTLWVETQSKMNLMQCFRICSIQQ